MPDNLLRRLRRYFFDVDAAGRTCHEDSALRRPVDDDADVRLTGDVGGWSDENLLHRKALDRKLENLSGHALCFRRRLRQLDPTRLATAARVDLGFYDHSRRKPASD